MLRDECFFEKGICQDLLKSKDSPLFRPWDGDSRPDPASLSAPGSVDDRHNWGFGGENFPPSVSSVPLW